MIEEVKRRASPIPTGADFGGYSCKTGVKNFCFGIFDIFLAIFKRGIQYLKYRIPFSY